MSEVDGREVKTGSGAPGSLPGPWPQSWPGWLSEVRLLGRFLREIPFLSLVVLLLLLCGVAVQRPAWLDLDVGAPPGPVQANSFDHLVGLSFVERVGRSYDLVFLRQVYDPEQGSDFSFRWTDPTAALEFAGLPRTALVLRLRMHGAVTGPATTTRLEIDGQQLAEFPVAFPLYHYAFVVDPALWSGDTLHVGLDSDPFLPGGSDPRRLGVAVDRVVLNGGAGRPALPLTAVYLAGAAGFLYLALRRAGLGLVAVTAVASSWGLVLLIALLLPSRFFVAAYAGGLFLAAALAYPLLLITMALAQGLFSRSSIRPGARDWKWLAVLFLAAFLFRFGGALSPRYASHDGLFHANRILLAERGELFFEHQSIEAGMRSDPYPGVLYLALSPFTLVVDNNDALLAFFLAWLAAGEIILFWFLARQVTAARTSRWAALLYGAFPIALSAFWFGIYANLFANWVALLVAVAVVLAWQGRLSTSPLPWVPLFALLFLAHFGTVILWIPLTLLWGALLYARGTRLQRHRVRQLLLSWGLGLLLVALVYYSYYYGFFGTMGAAVGAVFFPLEGTAEAATGFSLTRTLAEARVWWRWGVVADYAGLGLFLGGLGCWAVVRRRRRDAVTLLLIAMVAVAVFFWAISMGTAYFTRYMLFLLPAAALGCAQLLAMCWERGRAGRILAILLLAYVCGITVLMWIGLCCWGLHPPHVL